MQVLGKKEGSLMESMYEVIDMDDGSYAILEVKTNQVVARGLSLHEANTFVGKLNNGSGFEGNTPAFLTEGDNRNGC